MELTDIVRVLWTSIAGSKKIKGGVAIGQPEENEFHRRTCRGWDAQAGHRQKRPVGAARRELFKHVKLRAQEVGNVVIARCRIFASEATTTRGAGLSQILELIEGVVFLTVARRHR